MDQAQYIGAKTNELMDWKAKETFSIHLDPLKNPKSELGRRETIDFEIDAMLK